MINYDICSTICTLVVKILFEGIQILVKEEKISLYNFLLAEKWEVNRTSERFYSANAVTIFLS